MHSRNRYSCALLVLVIIGILGSPRALLAQLANFAPALDNRQEILASSLDRDSAHLFAYDATGTVVVWDLDNMTAIRRFTTVPADIWQLPNTFLRATSGATKNFEIHTNQNKYWIIDKNRLGNGKSGMFDVYGRVSGTRYFQSDTSAVTERIQLTKKDDGVVISQSWDKPWFDFNRGKSFYTTLTIVRADTMIMERLTRRATCLRLSPDDRYIAVGYEYAGVDIFSTETLELVFQSSNDSIPVKDHVNDIIFLNDSSGIVYSYAYSNPAGLFYHRFDAPSPQFMPCAYRPEHIAQSPSGALLAYSSLMSVFVVKPGDATPLYQTMRYAPGFSINTLHFIDEEVLLLAGGSFESTGYGNAHFSSGPAGLYKVDWQQDLWSANYIQPQHSVNLLNGILTEISDTAFRIRNFKGGYLNSWGHVVTPKNLENRFLNYDAQLLSAAANYLDQHQLHPTGGGVDSLLPEQRSLGLVQDDAIPESSWLAKALNTEKGALLQIADNPDGVFAGVATYKHQPGYQLMQIHSEKKLITWRKPQQRSGGMLHLLVTDYDGNIRLADSVQLFDEIFNQTPFQFSEDGNWFAYRRNCAEICYAPTADFNRKVTVPTGLSDTTYLPIRIQFDRASEQLAFQQYYADSLHHFFLARVQLGGHNIDTLFTLGLQPLSYALSADFNHLALHYSYDILDTVWINDNERRATAMGYGLRNVYAPTIVYIDLANDTASSMPVYNGIPAVQLFVSENRVTTLQNDGLIYYYDVNQPDSVLIHELDGEAQVILADDYYFASANKVDALNMRVGNDYYPVGKQDIYFNQPHRMMQKFGNSQTGLQALYKRAHEKRIQQFDTAALSTGAPPPRIAVDPAIRKRFYTDQPVLHVPVQLDPETPIASLLVTVNGYAVYGKNGLPIAEGARQQQLSLPLDPGGNNIRIHALSNDGRYANPVNLYYHAAYTPPKTPTKLWILAVGVSHYQDSTYNLKYAAKDARDITSVFTYKEHYDTVITRTLLDEQVTGEALMEQLQQAQSLGKDDVFILYLAGHGLLDASGEFHYATYDMQFDDPARRGLAYEQLMDALERLPSRNKVLLLDACHSGLVDRSRLDTTRLTYQTAEGHVKVQDARGTVVGNTRTQAYVDEQEVFLFMQDAFASFAYDNNISVLSAALGNNLALENSRLQNGLFTYALIRAIGLARAADRPDKFGTITEYDWAKQEYGERSTVTIAQIKTYVEQEVRRLSRGAQVPSFTLSRNAHAIRFSESYFPGYRFGSSFTRADGTVIVDEREQYRAFLDRYKELGPNPAGSL